MRWVTGTNAKIRASYARARALTPPALAHTVQQESELLRPRRPRALLSVPRKRHYRAPRAVQYDCGFLFRLPRAALSFAGVVALISLVADRYRLMGAHWGSLRYRRQSFYVWYCSNCLSITCYDYTFRRRAPANGCNCTLKVAIKTVKISLLHLTAICA